MVETNDKDRAAGAEGKPRQEEATSRETLKDLESTQADAAAKTTGGASAESDSAAPSAPSPDGAFDSERGGRADGGDSGGPM